MKKQEIKYKILEILNTKKMNLNELKKHFSLPIDNLERIIYELERDLLIKKDQDSYGLTCDNYHKIGKASIESDGNMVVTISKEEIYQIKKIETNAVIDGDTVLIKIIDKENKLAIIEDKKVEIRSAVGTIIEYNNNLMVNFDNPALNLNIKLDRSKGPFKVDDKVCIEFLSQKTELPDKVLDIRVLGNKNSIGVDITSIVRELGIRENFTKRELEQVDKIKPYVTNREMIERRDLRDEKIFTIDSSRATDLDDAIGIKILENNHYLVKVCIADVDHYVPENSILDITSKKRASSIYLLDRVIHMLPSKLSKGICSLKPYENRLTLTYEMEFDENGYLVNYDIYKSVIRSCMQMNYTDVEDVLTNKNSTTYKELQIEILLLYELSKKLRSIREENGYVNIENKPAKIIYDKKKGKISDIVLRKTQNSNQIIEEFMIATNKVGTMYAEDHNIPIIHRVQDDESRKQIEEKLEILEKLGFKRFDFPLNYSNNDILREIIEYYQNDENFQTIIEVMSNRNRSYYTTDKKNHSSLNEESYCHFTSPTRRYSDLYSSRQLKKYLKNKRVEQEAIIDILAIINEKSRNIHLCKSRQEGLKLAEYYQEKDELLSGKVININEKMIIIQFEDLTTGVLMIKDMPKYIFDQNTFTCIGKNNEIIKIGDIISVELVDINRYLGKAKFKIYE